MLVTLASTERKDAPAQTYFLPLALAWEDTDEERHRSLQPAGIAKVRQQAAIGILADALADERFCRALVEAIGEARELKGAHGVFRARPTERFRELPVPSQRAVGTHCQRTEQQQHGFVLGERLFSRAIGVWRRMNPEAEIGRFLNRGGRFPQLRPVGECSSMCRRRPADHARALRGSSKPGRRIRILGKLPCPSSWKRGLQTAAVP